jgi:HEAT repeat protein
MTRVVLVSAFVVALVLASVVGIGCWVWYLYYQRLPFQQAPLTYEEIAALQEKGPEAAPEIPRLLKCFDWNDESIRLEATRTLGAIGTQAIDPVRARLNDPNPKVRFSAVETFVWIDPPAVSAAPDILARLSDDSADVRYKAAFVLGRLKVSTDDVIEGLTRALNDSDKDVSVTAAGALKDIGAPAAPKLYQMLDSIKEPAREQILASLATLGKPPADALPTLADIAKSASPPSSQHAMKLLAQLGKPAVPTFQDLLKNHNPADRHALMEAIVQLGKDAKPLLPQLQKHLTTVRFWDAEQVVLPVFKQCGADGASGLVALLKSPYAQGGGGAAILTTIGEMKAEAKITVPVLIEMLQSRPGLRTQILETLGDIGPAAREAIPAVRALTNDPAVGQLAQTTLRRMGEIKME